MNSRDRFEEWVRVNKGWSLKPSNPGSLDDYMDTDTEIAWYGWQGQDEVVKNLTEALAKLTAINNKEEK